MSVFISSLIGSKYLAVIEMEAVGLSKTEAKVLTQRLTSKMIELSNYTIVERANIDKILKEQKFQHSGCTDSKCAVEIGQLLNADLTVIGTASKFGKTYTMDCRIINVESGQALTSASFTHTGEIDELVKDGIESISHHLLGLPYQKKRVAQSSPISSGYGATLEITSNPPGADIFIGGNYFDITPIILPDFPAGEYDIEMKLDGYENYSTSVKLLPRGSRVVNKELVIIPAYLSFTGWPSSNFVDIEIDGNTRTPFGQRIQVTRGQHIIKISANNHIDYEDTVTAFAGRTIYVNYNLKHNIGFLELDLLTENSTVFIDGKKIRGNKRHELSTGTHTLKVERKGYATFFTTFEINLGETLTQKVTLERLYGQLEVESTPKIVSLRIDDKELKLKDDFRLGYGKYKLKASAPFYYPQVIPIDISFERNQFNIDLKSGRKDLQRRYKYKKLGLYTTGILAGILATEYFMAEYSYSSYVESTNSIDAESNRRNYEKFTDLQTPTAIVLGITTLFSASVTLDIRDLKVKLGIN